MTTEGPVADDGAGRSPEGDDPQERELADLRTAYDVARAQVVAERARVIDMLTAERHDRHQTEVQAAVALAEARDAAAREIDLTRTTLTNLTTLTARAEAAEADAESLRVALREREAKIVELAHQASELQRHLDAVFASRTMRVLRPFRQVFARVRAVARKGRGAVRRARRLVSR